MFKAFLSKILPFLGVFWIRSLRVCVEIPENFCSGVLGLWHCDLLACTAGFKNKGVHILVSESQDGDFFAKTAEKLGFIALRGSSTHGSMKVRHLLKPLQERSFVGMALDGPKGPPLVVKAGSLWLAEKSKCPLWHLHPEYSRFFRLKTWDNFIVPLPFSKIKITVENKTERTPRV